MDGLAGDFGTFSYPDLIQLIGNRAFTGTLIVEIGSLKKTITIEEGNVTVAASTDPKEFFGRFLLNFGHAREEDLAQAMQTQSETRIYLGRILTMIGLVPEDTVRQVLTLKMRETLLDVYRWKAGTFRFERNMLPEKLQMVDAPVSLLDIHREGEFRETAWQAMTSAFPDGGLALKVDEAKAPKSLPPGSFDEKLYRAMRQGLTIDEIASALFATDFHLYQRLYALYRQGVITATQPPPRPPPQERVGEELGADAILEHAKEFLANGFFAEAETLAARANEIAPSPVTQALLKQAEAGLVAKLRGELLSSPMVPRLAIEPSRFKDLDLSQPEKYLLSRIDGQRNLAAILKAVPLRELDTLKYFRRLVDGGLVLLQSA